MGTVAEVRFGAGEAPLLVVRESGAREFLIPYAEEFVKAADFPRRRIEMELPEGLLELEAPLSSQEKQQQKSEADETRAQDARGMRRK